MLSRRNLLPHAECGRAERLKPEGGGPRGPVDIAGHEPSEFLRHAPVDIESENAGNLGPVDI